MSLARPTQSAQRGLRLRLGNTASTSSLPLQRLAARPSRLDFEATSSSARRVRPIDGRLIHTSSASAQAVEAVSRATNPAVATSAGSEPLSLTLTRAQKLADPRLTVLSAPWISRLDQLSRKALLFEQAAAHGAVPTRVVLVGSSLSQTRQLLAAMIDEPLREVGSYQINETEAILSALASLPPSTPFTIRYAPGPAHVLAESNTATLDRHWLQHANLHLTVLVDPESTEATYDLLYESEAALLVTDDYALSRSAHRPRASDAHGDAMVDLLCRFAAKPNVQLVVNSILGSDRTQVLEGLDAATGPSVGALLSAKLISVDTSDALAANASLRQALAKPDPQLVSSTPDASALLWDEFSRHFQRSNVGSLIDAVRSLESLQGSQALFAQSAAFLLQHCLDEALATVKRNQACLYQLRAVTAEASDREQATLKQSLERIWPPVTAYTGQLSSDDVHVWRPAVPGSRSAVDEAMRETDQALEATFDTKLQWWKLVWKVDDLRKELETACAGFAASLESDLAYESGRLATLQREHVRAADELVQQFRRLASELAPSIPLATRDAVLLTNDAEAGRISVRSLEPGTLMEPIERRRAQLLQVGGPIDVLATKSRRLAVTSSTAVAVTAAGLGSASVLGASLDATAASLALDPSTGVGLGLLTLTLVGWRMQGQYNKYRRRFRQDWQRFSEGLDQDLKRNFDNVLRNHILSPSTVASQRIIDLTRSWTQTVHSQEAHVRSIESQTPPSPPQPHVAQDAHRSP